MSDGATLTLRLNDTENLELSENGAFSFIADFLEGALYDVEILTQPLNHACSIVGSSGTINEFDITSVEVTCLSSFSIGGTISHYISGPVTLQLNGDDTVVVDSVGSFLFNTRLFSGDSYNVIMIDKPGDIVCTPSNPSGTVSSSNITNIDFNCGTFGP
ncbi:MAG: hypothetical protein O3A01_08030 [bacterium]|nr:hypothetical protein [bacterium]